MSSEGKTAPHDFEDLAERLRRFGELSIEADGSTYLFETMTPVGEDLVIEGKLPDGDWGQGDAVACCDDLMEAASAFDVDEHVELNLGGKGAPDAVTLVHDAEWIQDMLQEEMYPVLSRFAREVEWARGGHGDEAER